MQLAFIRYYSINRFGIPSIGNGPTVASHDSQESWHQPLATAIEQGKNGSTAYALPGTLERPWLDLSDPKVIEIIENLPDFPSDEFSLENHPIDLILDSPRR
ncbi:hypothetical protein [Acidovorax sp.]|uniref:hypothetical protein n=1 Tax=Acidovorax sp. TaxID=1872122 RepID=UPI003D0386C7